MVNRIKKAAHKFLPRAVFTRYHRTVAVAAAWWYGRPSEKLIVIGVTGTKGKSTTANLVAQLLEAAGQRVGLTSTATMKVAEREWLSETGMTMPGRFALQRMLKQMVRAGCTYAVIESSSEGIAQYRHSGINYDVVLLTNLSPEHIESHGSYEAYRAAKGMLFSHLLQSSQKTITGQVIPKRVVLNRDDKEFAFYNNFQAGELWVFSRTAEAGKRDERTISYQMEMLNATGATLQLHGEHVRSPLLFDFNVANVAAAVTVCRALGFSWATIISAIPNLRQIPGRQEFIRCGQPFTVVVDYTYEPTSMRAFYLHLHVVPHRKVIQVLGATGGGRDRWRRPVMGEIAAQNADVVIATTDDPYDEDPEQLADELLAGAYPVRAAGKAVLLEKIVDRTAAITRALALAEEHDLVLISGRGAEQRMAVANGASIPWDDRAAVREALHALGYTTDQTTGGTL